MTSGMKFHPNFLGTRRAPVDRSGEERRTAAICIKYYSQDSKRERYLLNKLWEHPQFMVETRLSTPALNCSESLPFYDSLSYQGPPLVDNP
ncbi:hypothetical protein TNCV_2411331 [Trichonephila clavipes]|nr:hypothetical protein TNCV_2411331 [Trichonephila clavipes]